MIDIVRIEMIKERSMKYGDCQIRDPRDIARIGFTLLERADREMFLVICLSARNQINSIKNIQVASVGTLQSALLHPREVFKVAILSNAASIAVLHNHPSGSPEPSRDDMVLTRKVIDAGVLLDIRVLDHVIVADERYYAFSESQPHLFK